MAKQDLASLSKSIRAWLLDHCGGFCVAVVNCSNVVYLMISFKTFEVKTSKWFSLVSKFPRLSLDVENEMTISDGSSKSTKITPQAKKKMVYHWPTVAWSVLSISLPLPNTSAGHLKNWQQREKAKNWKCMNEDSHSATYALYGQQVFLSEDK